MDGMVEGGVEGKGGMARGRQGVEQQDGTAEWSGGWNGGWNGEWKGRVAGKTCG